MLSLIWPSQHEINSHEIKTVNSNFPSNLGEVSVSIVMSPLSVDLVGHLRVSHTSSICVRICNVDVKNRVVYTGNQVTLRPTGVMTGQPA